MRSIPLLDRLHRLVVLAIACAPACATQSPPSPQAAGALRTNSPPLGIEVPDYESTSPREGAAQIEITARFVSAPLNWLRRVDLPPNDLVPSDHVLQDEDLQRVEERIAAGEAIVVASPSLRLAEGQDGLSLVLHQALIIEDVRVVEAAHPGENALEQVVSMLNTGVALDVKFELQDGEVVFTRLNPQLVLRLGDRVCAFEIDGVSEPAPCQEPVLLRATGARTQRRLEEGETLLARLDTRVEQHTSQVRQLAVSVEESFEPEPRTWGEGEREFHVLVSARRVPSGE